LATERSLLRRGYRRLVRLQSADILAYGFSRSSRSTSHVSCLGSPGSSAACARQSFLCYCRIACLAFRCVDVEFERVLPPFEGPRKARPPAAIQVTPLCSSILGTCTAWGMHRCKETPRSEVRSDFCLSVLFYRCSVLELINGGRLPRCDVFLTFVPR
jgi:hypothetical protein